MVLISRIFTQMLHILGTLPLHLYPGFCWGVLWMTGKTFGNLIQGWKVKSINPLKDCCGIRHEPYWLNVWPCPLFLYSIGLASYQFSPNYKSEIVNRKYILSKPLHNARDLCLERNLLVEHSFLCSGWSSKKVANSPSFISDWLAFEDSEWEGNWHNCHGLRPCLMSDCGYCVSVSIKGHLVQPSPASHHPSDVHPACQCSVRGKAGKQELHLAKPKAPGALCLGRKIKRCCFFLFSDRQQGLLYTASFQFRPLVFAVLSPRS